MTGDSFSAVEAAAEFLNVDWRREHGRLSGVFAGNQGEYLITIAARNVLMVLVVFTLELPNDMEADIGALCMDANWRHPDAGFFLSRGAGNRVVSEATLPLGELGELPDPAILHNTIRETVLNAELLWLLVLAMTDGTTLAEARALRPLFYRALARGEHGGLPACLIPSGLPAPGSDITLIDACSAATRARGWTVFRRAPDQLVVGSRTFVDVHNDVLIVSSYAHGPVRTDRRTSVSLLLNELLCDGAPFSFALDLDTGTICTRTWLNLSGASAIPPPDLLCAVIHQSGAGSRMHAEQIERVATAAGERPFGPAGGSLRERLRQRAS